MANDILDSLVPSFSFLLLTCRPITYSICLQLELLHSAICISLIIFTFQVAALRSDAFIN